MRFIWLALCALLAACSTVSYNPTVYPYHMDEEALEANPPKTLLLASVNVSGEPTLSMLRKAAPKIDEEVLDRLKSQGYKIAPTHLFDNAWNQALYTYGDFYDPTSGKVDRRNWQAVMANTLSTLKVVGGVDAVVFTDLIAHDVQHSSGMNHYARWYGVTRKPATQGAGSGVPVDFNWSQPVKAASLIVTIYDLNGRPLFASRGGIDTLSAIDMRKPHLGFVRRDKVLKNTSFIEEGVALALHPLIPMDRYPGKKKGDKEEEADDAEKSSDKSDESDKREDADKPENKGSDGDAGTEVPLEAGETENAKKENSTDKPDGAEKTSDTPKNERDAAAQSTSEKVDAAE